jgi:hypothetical protein
VRACGVKRGLGEVCFWAFGNGRVHLRLAGEEEEQARRRAGECAGEADVEREASR